MRLRGFGIGAEDAALLGGLSRLQRLQLDGVAFAGRTIISKLASLQVTPPSPEPILRCLELMLLYCHMCCLFPCNGLVIWFHLSPEPMGMCLEPMLRNCRSCCLGVGLII